MLLPEITPVEQVRTTFACYVQVLSDMGLQFSSWRGVTASNDMHHKSPLLLPTDETVALEQLSTCQLKLLALHAGEHSVGIQDRAFLLTSIKRTSRAAAGTSWLVQDAMIYSASSTPCPSCGTLQRHDRRPTAQPLSCVQGVTYQRALGAMVSMAGELYVYGGFSTSCFLAEKMVSILREDDPAMVKLNKDTRMWEPVTHAGAPAADWSHGFVNTKGIHILLHCCSMFLQHQQQATQPHRHIRLKSGGNTSVRRMIAHFA